MKPKNLAITLSPNVLRWLPVGVLLLGTTVQADVIYRETFGRPDSPTTDGDTRVWGWQDFLSTGAPNSNTNFSGINGSTSGRPNNVANVNAGPNSDGTFGAYARGIHFYTTGAVGPVLTFTGEYTINPADYQPGSLTFSWYEGNATTTDTMRLAIRVGSQWFAGTTAFSTAATTLANFPTQAALESVIFDPTAANWVTISFDGSYDGGYPGTSLASSTALSLGATPGADLSGLITGFGVYVEGTAGTRRFDTFEVNAAVIPEPGSLSLVTFGSFICFAIRRKQIK